MCFLGFVVTVILVYGVKNGESFKKINAEVLCSFLLCLIGIIIPIVYNQALAL